MAKRNSQTLTQVALKIAEIEAEMKAIGYWQSKPLPNEAYDFQQAFAMDTMSFAQWLQFILLPRVAEILEQKADFPTDSMVGVQAMREFDTDVKASRLTLLLSEFDEIINRQ
jgi:uncharacterized protein YqcC (DUF446 family)